MQTILKVAGVAFVLACSVGVLHSAQAAALAGRITDRSGSVLPGVTVTIVPERGGVAQHTSTDDFGRYRVETVPDGTYRVDFALAGFELTRVNHVRIGAGGSASIDGVLKVGSPCTYLRQRDGALVPQRPLPEASQPVEGQVLDEAGRPLPHATVELTANRYVEESFTDRDGRFLVRVPVGGTSELTVFDSGFERLTQQISPAAAALVFRLRFTGTQDVEESERLDRRWSSCSLFAHAGP